MEQFRCIKSFDSAIGKTYNVGDLIDSYEYTRLYHNESINFEKIYYPSASNFTSVEDSPGIIEPILDILNSMDFGSSSDSSDSGSSFDFGGGDTGGGGASGDW